MSKYGYTKEIDLDFNEALEAVKSSIQEEGFGILTEIDVKKTLREKIGKEVEPYVILGPCSPEYAHRALEMEREIGLLLPCNVIVYEKNDRVYTSAINTKSLLSITDNEDLNEVADTIKEKLERAIDNAVN